MVLNDTKSQTAVRNRIWGSAQRTVEADFHKLTFQAMSTICRVHFQTTDSGLANEFQNLVLNWVSAFEAKYSRFLPDSLIGRINAAAGEHWVDIDLETEALFNLCQDLLFFTRGVFDPTGLPLMRLWNWKAKEPVIPSSKEIQEALQLVGWRKLQRRPNGVFLPRAGMMIDLGGIGKEYAVDRVLVMGLEHGLKNILVDFGQDVRVHGESPQKGAWYIGLDDPRSPGKCWTAVMVNNHAVATSGDYLRHFIHQGRRYGHIIDPRDGYPANTGVLSASVVSPHCTFAGIVSTAAVILGPKEGLEMMSFCPGVEGVITTDSSRFQTKGFNNYAIH
jgi:thiamine biosynthesis lipoprotein